MGCSGPLGLPAVLLRGLVLIQELLCLKGGEWGTGCGEWNSDPPVFLSGLSHLSTISLTASEMYKTALICIKLPFGQNAFPLKPVWQHLLEQKGSQVWETTKSEML